MTQDYPLDPSEETVEPKPKPTMQEELEKVRICTTLNHRLSLDALRALERLAFNNLIGVK